MLNMNGLWPQMPASSADAPSADVWGLGSVFETQARLWNHMLDANRSLWELYMPWLSAGPSIFTAAFAPLESAVEAEPARQPGNGVSEAMESQARSWNELLDAQRTFWAAFGWPATTANGAATGNGAAPGNGAASEEPDGDRPAPRRSPPAARKSARPGRSG